MSRLSLIPPVEPDGIRNEIRLASDLPSEGNPPGPSEKFAASPRRRRRKSSSAIKLSASASDPAALDPDEDRSPNPDASSASDSRLARNTSSGSQGSSPVERLSDAIVKCNHGSLTGWVPILEPKHRPSSSS